MTAAYRLNRLFDPTSHRLLDVAVDHGLFGEPSFLTGIEDVAAVVADLVEAGPDAVQLSPGLAHLLQAVPGRTRPALVLRADVANAYGSPLDQHLYSVHVPDAVERAVRLDAAALCVNLLQLPGHPEVREACVRSVLALRREAEAAGMPLMVEPLVMADASAGGYTADGDVDRIVTLVRQAVELGADLVKADPTTRVEDYHRVVQAAQGVPVLVRGGGRVPDTELLARTEAVLAQGASGVVYGRNVVQHPRPSELVAALMAVLHRGATAQDAAALLDGAAA